MHTSERNRPLHIHCTSTTHPLLSTSRPLSQQHPLPLHCLSAPVNYTHPLPSTTRCCCAAAAAFLLPFPRRPSSHTHRTPPPSLVTAHINPPATRLLSVSLTSNRLSALSFAPQSMHAPPLRSNSSDDDMSSEEEQVRASSDTAAEQQPAEPDTAAVTALPPLPVTVNAAPTHATPTPALLSVPWDDQHHSAAWLSSAACPSLRLLRWHRLPFASD